MSINSFRGEVEALSDERGFDDSDFSAVQENSYNHNVKNGFTGTVGAFLFALVGGILWYFVYQTGFIVGLVGVATMALAIYGYTIFGNGLSRFGIAVSVIIAVAMIFLAEYCCAAKDIYDAFKYWYSTGETEYSLTFVQSAKNVFNLLTEKGKQSYGIDLAIGYCLSIVSGALYFGRRRKAYGGVKNVQT